MSDKPQTGTPLCKTKTVYIEPSIRTIAGGFVMVLAVLLYFRNELALVWLAILIFLGFNLFQSGISGFCLLEKLLKYFRFTSELDEIRSLSQDLKAISDQQAAYLDTLNLLNEAVVELSPDGCIITASDGWARLIGERSIQNSINQALADYLVDSDRSLLTNLLGILEHQAGNTQRLNFRLVATDQQTRWVSANFMMVRQGDRKIIKGVLSDISEGKRLEDERRNFHRDLTHARRLSSLGEMAAGLAHELNQPLAAVNLYIQGCLQRLEADPHQSEEIREAMQAARQQAKRAGDIIRQIRSFVRKAPLNRIDTDINALAKEALQLLDSDPALQETEFRFEFGDRLPLIPLDRLQIQQVLINLISNAIESMEGIEGQKKVTIRTLPLGGSVVVEIRDRGKGVSENIAAQLFEPFVTGRENGLGLGLAISRSIIEQHGGKLWYKSSRNSGSCFNFTLPTTIQDDANDTGSHSIHR